MIEICHLWKNTSVLKQLLQVYFHVLQLYAIKFKIFFSKAIAHNSSAENNINLKNQNEICK